MSALAHSWLHPFTVSFVPGPLTPLLTEFTGELLQEFKQLGHTVLERPEDNPDVLLTTAIFNQPVHWRDSLFFSARRRFRLAHPPTVFTIVHITPSQLAEALAVLEISLQKPKPSLVDYPFPGLTQRSFHTLYEQGQRGGPFLSTVRLLQAQMKCVRILLVVGDQHPLEAYTIDLVGGHPLTSGNQPDTFYTDLVLRIATAVCTYEITKHEVVGEPVSRSVWESLATPPAMLIAGQEFGARHFFTEMVNVANLVSVPVFDSVISSQYSEGCYSTWDPDLEALITTVTGSARPVDKGHLTENELAIIVSARPDGLGARIRYIEGQPNDPPSSEAVELIEMDSRLPRLKYDRITSQLWDFSTQALANEGGEGSLCSPGYGIQPKTMVKTTLTTVPVTRSKLHGHRGVSSYDPRWVEHVYLDQAYYDYPVSCSTKAQAGAIQAAFGRAEALTNPADPRLVVFTVLPGHGVLIVEKWVAGKAPFQVIWELMDDNRLEIANLIPQGALEFKLKSSGRMILEEN
jgi:hypothetical protein